jgi:D-alanine transfer protein
MAAATCGFDLYARSLETRHVSELANTELPQIPDGSALQRAALARSELLPIYGGSEVVVQDIPSAASRFFRTYPTGFTVFTVARAGASFLTIAQELAALSPDLRGKKIVISFTPSAFYTPEINAVYYRGNFSRLHANELVFSPYLSMNLKQMAARRMLNFPDTLENDPLLKYGLGTLAGTSGLNQSLYYLIWPLGEFQTALFRLQDHADAVSFILSHGESRVPVSYTPASIDWKAALTTAHAEQFARTLNNPYGVDDLVWTDYRSQHQLPAVPGSLDQDFIQSVNGAKEWGDLEILLELLKELGAKPLIMGRPMNAQLWEAFGVSRQAQNTYYSKLQHVVDSHQFPLVDFQQYAEDKYFSTDGASHSSPEGWIYVDQALNAFYQGWSP